MVFYIKVLSFSDMENFLVKIQDSLSKEFLRGVLERAKVRDKKELLPPLCSASDRW